jgi:hypothetical protein
MRLSRPSLICKAPVVHDSLSVEASLLLSAKSELFDDNFHLNELGVTHLLGLPPNFGNIYLGEMFTSYLIINLLISFSQQ